jgi:CDP-6-deoxy-D-xylo-4-hexulose-3-dehydrase
MRFSWSSVAEKLKKPLLSEAAMNDTKPMMNSPSGRDEIIRALRRFYGKARPTDSGRIQYAGAVYGSEEVEAFVNSMLDGWFALSRRGAEFEKKLAEVVGTREAILVNSGSSANLLSIAALVETGRLEPGDEVITPLLSFPTLLNPLLLYGLRPVLVDVDVRTLNVTAKGVKAAVGRKTKALVLPHLLGNVFPVAEIKEIAERERLVLVEDCCDALGSRYKGRHVGTFGTMATFSFYVAHQITMGEGGAICTSDHELAEALRSLREWGRVVRDKGSVYPSGRLPPDYSEKYTYLYKGFNLRPLEFQAAFGLVQLQRLPAFSLARKRNHEMLHRYFQRYAPWISTIRALKGAEPCWYSFPLLVREGAPFTREEILKHLDENNVETRPIFTGNLLRQPAYRNLKHVTIKGGTANADYVTERAFFVGLYPGIDETKLNRMIAIFDEFLRSYS